MSRPFVISHSFFYYVPSVKTLFLREKVIVNLPQGFHECLADGQDFLIVGHNSNVRFIFNSSHDFEDINGKKLYTRLYQSLVKSQPYYFKAYMIKDFENGTKIYK